MVQQDIADTVFNGWQAGESAGSYDRFKSFLDADHFAYFSHPLRGSFKGMEAYKELMAMVEEREAKPNQLLFSGITCYQYQNGFCYQFDSEGKISGGYDYKGYNIIQLEMKDDKLIGFREYFGYINPFWFK